MVELDFDKVKRLAGRLPRRDKAELARYLDERTLFPEVRRVRLELKSLSITKAKLDAEVHAAKRRLGPLVRVVLDTKPLVQIPIRQGNGRTSPLPRGSERHNPDRLPLAPSRWTMGNRYHQAEKPTF